jgi:steroid delta-isomerase-like uncharacterized protein
MGTAIDMDVRALRDEIIDQHITAENRHDPAAVVATFDKPRYDVAPFGDAGHVEGADAVHDLWAGLIAGFPDVHIEPEPHLHADDAVFVEVELTGTHQGEWAGLPPTGRSVAVRIACLYEFEEERLVGERVYFDFATLLRQLGFLKT